MFVVTKGDSFIPVDAHGILVSHLEISTSVVDICYFKTGNEDMKFKGIQICVRVVIKFCCAILFLCLLNLAYLTLLDLSKW